MAVNIILYKAGQPEFSSRHKNKLHRIKTRKANSSTTINNKLL